MGASQWDREVVLVWAPIGQLRVWRERMTLRAALEAFSAFPAEVQASAGIGLNEPIYAEVEGRPALIGWHNAEACRVLAAAMPAAAKD